MSNSQESTQNEHEQHPITPPALPFTARASLVEYRRRLGVMRFVLAMSLTLVFYVRFGLVVWILSVVGLAVLIVVILVLLSRRSVTITPSEVTYSNAIGAKRSVQFQQIADSRVFINFVEPGFGVVPRLIIGTTDKKPFASFTALLWHVEDMDKIVAALASKGVIFEYYQDIAQSATIAKQFPESLLAYEKHPMVIALVAVAAIVVAVVVGVLLFM